VRGEALKGPARMPEGGTRRQGYIMRPVPVRSPRTGGISNKKTRDEDRRLKEKGEHGIHPVVPPALLDRPDMGRHHDLYCRKLARQNYKQRASLHDQDNAVIRES
jgi:hypothetical protein